MLLKKVLRIFFKNHCNFMNCVVYYLYK